MSPNRRALPVVERPVTPPASLAAPARARPRIERDADRRIAFGGLAVAAMFLAAALASTLLPASTRIGLWLPLHLALAGGAGVAIAAMLPFFTTALAVAAPAAPRLRIAAIAGIGLGAVLVSAGHAVGAARLAEAGGALYLVGVGVLGWVAFAPLRGALGPRRRPVELGYAVAIACVAVGALVGTLFVSGHPGVLAAWGTLKPAHGWLNVFGFVSLVVAATLVHLAPTVAGSRIRPRRSATVAIVGLALGVPLVAAGYVVVVDGIVRAGALAVGGGAAALVVHGASVRRDRGGWTTDLDWHRVAEWSLVAAAGWFAVTVVIAAGRAFVLGADPAGWRIDLFAAPLVLGWVAQVLVGSWTHVLPAIGPGDQARHARQRAVLGISAVPRLLAWNGGVAILAIGLPLGATPLVAGGAVIAGSAVLSALVLFVVAAMAPRAVRHGPA